MKQLELKKFLPGIAWFFIVLILICMPGRDVPAAGMLDKIYIDKWVHAGIFGMLAFLFMWPLAKLPLQKKQKLQYFIYIAIVTCGWGLLTELIQKYLVTGRSYDLLDWIADSIGALIALWYATKTYLKRS